MTLLETINSNEADISVLSLSITQHIFLVDLLYKSFFTGWQVAAESHEAAAADAPGSTAKQLKCMSVSLIPCQLHLSVTSHHVQLSEGSTSTSVTVICKDIDKQWWKDEVSRI